MATTTKITPADEICQSIAKAEPQYAATLPPHIPPERFVRVAQTAVRMTPKLALPDMDRNSLYAAFLKCAQDGLLPDGREAAIVPWGKAARYMVMIGGLTKKARNSGEIRSISSQVVYEKDKYRAWEDEKGQHFEFEKSKEADRGKPVVTYAYAITKDGALYFEEIAEADMEKIEKMSKADDSPWKGPFRDEMKKKSALRRLLKYRVPSSTDLDDMIRADDDLYSAPPAAEKSTPSTSSRLRDAVQTTAQPTPAPVAAVDEVANECIDQEELPI